MNVRPRYLLDRDPTEQDVQEMLRWKEIYEFEVQRIVRVLDHFKNNVFKPMPRLRAVKGAKA